jgi:hypothetical protein
LLFLWVLLFVQRAFPNKMQSRIAYKRFFEVGYFERFDESFIITLKWTTWIGRQTLRCERTWKFPRFLPWSNCQNFKLKLYLLGFSFWNDKSLWTSHKAIS